MRCKITLDIAERRLNESKKNLASVKSFLERQYTKFGGEVLYVDTSLLQELCLLEKVYVYEKAVARLRGTDENSVCKPEIPEGAEEELRQRILAKQVSVDNILLSGDELNSPDKVQYGEKSVVLVMFKGKPVSIRTDILAKYNSGFAMMLANEFGRTAQIGA